MSGNDGVAASDIMQRDWYALRDQCDRVRFESGYICETARQLRADVAEARTRSQDDRERRAEATMGRRP